MLGVCIEVYPTGVELLLVGVPKIILRMFLLSLEMVSILASLAQEKPQALQCEPLLEASALTKLESSICRQLDHAAHL